MRNRPLLCFAVAAVTLGLGAGRASAHGGYSGVSGDLPRPASPPGDGATAERIVKTLAGKKRDASMAKVIAEPLRQARAALERARGARVSGDVRHARMFDAVALEWAETARDLERAAAAEAVASTSAGQAREVGTKVERARTLLSETQARRGHAAAELERLEADAKDRSKSAAGSEQERIDAAKKKAGKPAKAKPKPDPKPKADAGTKPEAKEAKPKPVDPNPKAKPESKPTAPPAGAGKKQAGVR